MSYHQHRALVDTQSVDPLGLAREIAEESSLGQMGELGYGLMLLHRQKDLTRAIYSENDDIHYDMDIEPCLRVLVEEGFDFVEVGPAKTGRHWLLWHDELKLLGQLTSHCLFEGREKINSLVIDGQFIGALAMDKLRADGYSGSGTVAVRRSDLEDINVRSWNIRDGLRHFMHSFKTSEAQPVDRWVLSSMFLGANSYDMMKNLSDSAQATIHAGVDILAINELHLYGK